MLDDEHRVAGIDEIVQHLQEQLDIGEVQAGRWFIEQVQRAAGRFFDKLSREFDALCFAAGERGRGLADLDVIEADVVQRFELLIDLRDVFEMAERFLHVHFEHLRDALFAIHHLQRFAIEAMAAAHRAGDPDVGQEVHFEPIRAVAVARFAAAALHVEAEAARLVAAAFRFGKLRVEVADVVEQLDVRGRVRSRRAADRRLIDDDELVELVDAFDAIVLARLAFATHEIAEKRLGDDVVDQRAFAGTARTGDADERAERDFDVDVFEVVVACADDAELDFGFGSGIGIARECFR